MVMGRAVEVIIKGLCVVYGGYCREGSIVLFTGGSGESVEALKSWVSVEINSDLWGEGRME